MINTIVCGDCLIEMAKIPDKSIDMILCDLPYGTTACKWDTIIPFEPLWEQYKRIIKDNGAIVLTASQPFTSALVMSNPKWFKCTWYWKKEKGVGFTFAKFMPMRQIEEVVVFCEGKSTYNPQMEKLNKPYSHVLPRRKAEQLSNCNIATCKNGKSIYKEYTHKYPTNIIEFARESTRNNPFKHPTQKPVALFEYLIKTYTNEGELVLDNCAGSFTTAIASENLKRNWICIEKEAEYCAIGEKRIKKNRERLHNIVILS